MLASIVPNPETNGGHVIHSRKCRLVQMQQGAVEELEGELRFSYRLNKASNFYEGSREGV